jgi:hypothetical protein
LLRDAAGWLANIQSRKGSGYDFPVPRRKLPANLYLNFRLISKFLTSSHFKPIKEARQKEGMMHKFPGFLSYNEKVTYILPTTPESDFPSPVPPNIICCGPIVLPSAPLSIVDPELETWLRGRPTVLLSLGSFLRTSEKHAQELASGIKMLLDRNLTIQVLWKLKTDESLYETVNLAATKILSEHIESGRVRTHRWLKAAPSEIVRSGYVVCSAHHGGSSSYFEALRYLVIHFPVLSQTSYPFPQCFITNLSCTVPAYPKSCYLVGGTPTNLPPALNT